MNLLHFKNMTEEEQVKWIHKDCEHTKECSDDGFIYRPPQNCIANIKLNKIFEEAGHKIKE